MNPRRDVHAYPNPFHEEVTIELAPGSFEEFTLYTSMGKELKRWKPNSTAEKISLTDFPAAVYVLQAKSAGRETVYLQLVKQD